MNKILTISFFLLIIGLGSGYAQESGQLTVSISGFENKSGIVRIALYQGEENYMKKSLISRDTVVYSQDEVVVLFSKVPFGEYAIALYHDENANGKLDKNFIGIPTEDYAFSNNADGRFGPPDYKDCIFIIDQKENTQTIKIN